MHQQMLSSVSHDLKTPLASVIGSLEIYQRLKNNLSEDKKVALITTALDEAHRLDQFISNILDMARLESGMLRLKPEPMAIDPLLKQAIQRVGSRSSQGQIRLIARSGVPEVHVDAPLISRALSLMIDNALKYGQPQKQAIEIRYDVTPYELHIEIEDSGPGIPESRHREVFDKYARITRQDNQIAGTGLGLSIARAIARHHNGELSLRNSVKGGAIFTLSLPLMAYEEPKKLA